MLTRHIRHTLFCTITIAIATVCIIATSACSDDNKGMLPGEVRLKDTSYKNDSKLSSVTVSAEGQEDITVSSLELRTLWHAIVINAEDNFEYADEKVKNTYESPVEAEQQFYARFHESMELFREQFPDTQQAAIEEFTRAKVSAQVKYVWCAQTDEYVTLKFEVSPQTGSSSAPEEEK